MAIKDHLERRTMTQSPRISLTNLIALGSLAFTIFASAAILYSKVESQGEKQQEINMHLKETDDRLEARELAIDAKLNEIRDSQIRVEEQIKKRTH